MLGVDRQNGDDAFRNVKRLAGFSDAKLSKKITQGLYGADDAFYFCRIKQQGCSICRQRDAGHLCFRHHCRIAPAARYLECGSSCRDINRSRWRGIISHRKRHADIFANAGDFLRKFLRVHLNSPQ